MISLEAQARVAAALGRHRLTLGALRPPFVPLTSVPKRTQESLRPVPFTFSREPNSAKLRNIEEYASGIGQRSTNHGCRTKSPPMGA